MKHLPPEIMNGKSYDEAADLWNIGILLYFKWLPIKILLIFQIIIFLQRKYNKIKNKLA